MISPRLRGTLSCKSVFLPVNKQRRI